MRRRSGRGTDDCAGRGREPRLAACPAGSGGRAQCRWDWYAFTLPFKGVVLEGLEVAFIVVTFGANQGSIPLAVLGAAAAVLAVTAAGFAAHRPLARVPENTLKFIVGILLTSFGTFWGAEGAGATWPGGDAALLAVIGAMAASALLLTAYLRRANTRSPTSADRPTELAV